MTLCFYCFPKWLYLESPQEPPHTKRYISFHILPVRWRMSGIHRMFFLPKSLCTMEEKISRNIGAVMKDGVSPDLTNIYSDSNSVYQIYEIGATISWMIGIVKFPLIPSRNVSETKLTIEDLPQANKFQSKGHHATVSPEELIERWQIGLKQARETIVKTTQRFTR